MLYHNQESDTDLRTPTDTPTHRARNTTTDTPGAMHYSAPVQAPGQPHAAGSEDLAHPRASRQRTLWLASLVLLLALAVGGGTLVIRNGGLFGIAPGAPVTLGAAAAPVRPDANTEAFQQVVIDAINAVQPSVVEVRSHGVAGQQAVGSGNILTADGYLVTNDHVVRGFGAYEVQLASGKTYTARLVGEAPQDDLAVLKIDATGLRPIALGATTDVRVGQFVLALGSPLGLQQSATFGIVSALDRTASEAPNGPASLLTGLIQTSAPINPGNSGGALVNLSGELVGVPTLGAVGSEGQAANGIGFAIPTDRVRFVAEQLIRDGHVTNSGQGFLGIRGVDVTPQLATTNGLPVDAGVLVTAFTNAATRQSPAQAAGLRVGDILTAADGKPVSGNADLVAILLSRAPGSSLSLTVVRGGEHIHVAVTLGERPASIA